MNQETPKGQGPVRPAEGRGGSNPGGPTRRSETRSGLSSILHAAANVLSVGLIVYLTYFFTTFFSHRAPAPAVVSEETRVAAKKLEERRAEDRKLLTTYGPLDPATRTLRLPVERGMDLLVAESSRTAPAAAPNTLPAAAPAPVTAQPSPATSMALPAVTSAPAPPQAPQATAPSAPATPVSVAVVNPAPVAVAPAPARAGLPPAQLYRAICQACHDVDGRGSIVRKAMPVIPDFTNKAWQVTRTDAELRHSMLEGKGQLMLPMKDKFALARTDPAEMVAFVRGFQPGGAPAAAPAIASAATTPASVAPPTTPAVPATAAPVLQPPAAGVTAAASPAPASPTAVASASQPGPATAAPANAPPPSSSSAALSEPLSPEALALFAPTPAPVAVPSRAGSAGARDPKLAARLRAASVVYQTNCQVCHGPDGRGTTVRPAMPPIPDFTSRDWHTGKNAAQFSVSILEGKGALMPPWRGKITNEQVKDLAAYIQNFGPADLLAAGMPASDYGNRFRALNKEWEALNAQLRALSGK